MGMGDVKLAFLMGAALGSSVTVAMFLGMLAALVPGVVLLAAPRAGRPQDGRPLRAVPRPRLGRSRSSPDPGSCTPTGRSRTSSDCLERSLRLRLAGCR